MEIIERSAWGARPAESVTPWNPAALFGVTVHWFGSPSSYSDHARCDDLVRAVQAGHQAGEFNDIAYNHLVCRHGHVYEGRGFDRQTGANGTTYSNQHFAAVCVMVGTKDVASVVWTPEVKAALAWIIREWQRRGTGTIVRRHGYWTGSECPGPFIGAWVDAGRWRSAPLPPARDEDENMTEQFKAWAWWRLVAKADPAARPEIIDGFVPTAKDWEDAEWAHRLICMYGPHPLYTGWRDYRLLGVERPDAAPDTVPPRWWDAANADHSFAKAYMQQPLDDEKRKTEAAIAKVASLQAQLDTALAELAAAKDASDDEIADLEARIATAREQLAKAIEALS